MVRRPAGGIDGEPRNGHVAVSFLLPAGSLVDQLAWVAVAAAVTIGTSTLVARRRTAEDRLAALLAEAQTRRGEAESRNEQKTALLAQVAHELRQPLSAMTTAARLLDDGDVAPDAKARAAGVIARQTEHLRRLIDDLFDLSRMTRNELRVRKARMSRLDLRRRYPRAPDRTEPPDQCRQVH